MTEPLRVGFNELVGYDLRKRRRAAGPIAGVDEAGRGALAGPVVAAAVICEPCERLSRVRDSKLVSEPVREELFELIRERSLSVGVGIVGPGEIDRLNILRATLRAMREAVTQLDTAPGFVLVDGRHLPALDVPAEAIKGGDRKSFSIAAASIVAKVTRDRIMRECAVDFPIYGFVRNKGYGTREHIRAIARGGRTSIHRASFTVRSLTEGGGECEGKHRHGHTGRGDRISVPAARRMQGDREKRSQRSR
jgi:ribonuclease HII